jgi:hypothetical protein
VTYPITRIANERDAALAKVIRFRALLQELVDEFDAASQYKGEFLRAKHGDVELILRVRAALREEQP